MGRMRIVFKDIILVIRNLFCYYDERKIVDDFRNLWIIYFLMIESQLSVDMCMVFIFEVVLFNFQNFKVIRI